MPERRVLVIATHPDDELLGCGGTVARHTAKGDRAASVIVCEGESLRQALLVATRPTQPSIQVVYAFDSPSSTEWACPRTFVPDTWIDISCMLEPKLRAMACHESEVWAYPHPRSLQAIEHRARVWGAHASLPAAEVFKTVRRVERDVE